MAVFWVEKNEGPKQTQIVKLCFMEKIKAKSDLLAAKNDFVKCWPKRH